MICPALRFFGAAILTSFSLSRPVQNSKTGLGLVLGGQIKQAEYEAANYLGGTIYPVVLGGTAQAIAKERLEKLKQLLEDEKEGL